MLQRRMFENLRLINGGGLRLPCPKIDQARNSVTLCIGIGGTGISSLREFKRIVHERMCPDGHKLGDPGAAIFRGMRFLEIDCDDEEVFSPNPSTDIREDFFKLGKTAGIPFKMAMKPQWFNEDIDFVYANEGAGGIRQVGRFLLSEDALPLYNRINDELSRLKSMILPGYNINVHIMAGLGGGTGSGCFIDVCYIVQQALYILGIQNMANVNGFFFLPDVLTAKRGFPRGGADEAMIKRNGFASLKELDYLMNISDNEDVFMQQYSCGFRVEQTIPPVKHCYLISATDKNGDIVPNGYHNSVGMVAEYIYNLTIDNTDALNIMGQRSFRDIDLNIAGRTPFQQKEHSANHCYTFLGGACVNLPRDRAFTYAGILFLDAIKQLRQSVPEESDVKSFCDRVGINLQNLNVMVRPKVASLNLDPERFDSKTLMNITSGMISTPLAVNIDHWREIYQGELLKNINKLTRCIEYDEESLNSETIIADIFREIISIIKTPGLGLYFAWNMLSKSDLCECSIFDILEGIRKEVYHCRNHFEYQISIRYSNEVEALEELRSSNFINRKSGKVNYLLAVRERCQAEIEAVTYKELERMINIVCRQIEELRETYLKKLIVVTDGLIDAFEENAGNLAMYNSSDNKMSIDIVPFEVLRSEVDAAFSNKISINRQKVAAEFFAELIYNASQWREPDDAEMNVAEILESFLLSKIGYVFNKTTEEYLMEYYRVSSTVLIDRIESEIIEKIFHHSGKAALCANKAVFNTSVSSSNVIGNILFSFPANSPDFLSAAMSYKGVCCVTPMINYSAHRDSYYMFELLSGVPLYVVESIYDMQAVYNGNRVAGTHLYECEEKDWHNLPSPIPATFEKREYVNPDGEKVAEVLDLYEKAVEKGLIVEDINNMCATVYFPERCDLREISNYSFSPRLAEELKNYAISEKTLNVNDFDEMLAKLLDCLDMWRVEEGLLEVEKMLGEYKDMLCVIANLKAESKNRDLFYNNLRDDFVRKPIIATRVKSGLDMIRKIEEIISFYRIYREKKELFFNALLYGIISGKWGQYNLEFEHNGELMLISLSQNYKNYTAVPTYMAFLNFRALDEETLNRVKAKISELSENKTEEIYENAEKLLCYYESQKIEYIFSSKLFENGALMRSFLMEICDRLAALIRY